MLEQEVLVLEQEVLVKDLDGRKQRNTCGTQSMHDAMSFFL